MPQSQVQEREATVEDLIDGYAKQLGIPSSLALAVARKESNLNPNAVGDSGLKRGPSVGVFQLSPPAAQDVGVDPADPIANIYGGVKYLKTLSDKYDGDVEKILHAYNGGMGNVEAGSVSPAAQAYAADVIASLGRPPETAVTSATTPPAMKPVASHEAAPPAMSPGLLKRFTNAIALPSEQIAPMAGAMIGGVRGAQMGAPAGPYGMAIGAVAGAGAGAFGGESIQMGLESLGSLLGFGGAPPTPTETVTRLGTASQTGMVGEALNRVGLQVLTPIAQKIAAPLRSKLALYAREAMDAFPAKAILPSEISQSRSLNIAENIAEGSIFGGSKISKVKELRQGLAESKVVQTLESLSIPTTSKAAGVGVQAARKTAVRQFREAENAAWDVFRAEGESVPVKTPKLDAFVAELQGKEATAILPNAGAEAARRVAQLTAESNAAEKLLMGDYASLSEVSKDLIRAQMDTKQALTASQFQRTVSDIGKLTRALERSAATDPSKYNAQLGAAKKLLNLAREDLRDSLVVNPRALQAYEMANETSRMGNERLFNKAVRDIARKAPEQIVSSLVKPNNSTAINLVADAAGDEAMEPVRRLAIERMVATNPKTGQIEWGDMSAKLATLGDDTLNALFPNGQAEEMKRLSRVMQSMKRQPAGSIGRVGIFLTQWGPVVGAATGALPPSAVITLGAPWVMARVMASPTGLKWLTTGLKAPAGSDLAIRAAAHLTAFLKRELPETQPVASHEPVQ